MTEKDDLRARLYELHVGTDEHHATARQIRVMILDGDLAGAADALDALELDIHTALAAGAGPGGSGLPEQWTDGGNGDVTATVDDPEKTPFTITGDTAQSSALLVLNEDDDGSNYNDVFVVVGDTGGNVSNIFSIDSAGEVTIQTKDVGASALRVLSPPNGTAAFGAHLVQVAAESGGIGGTLLDIEADGKFSVGNSALPNGLRLLGPHAAPADAALNAGTLMLWFDQTDGAAKLMIKGKSANGTVVTGQVALS
jgi:hypothetical protein